MRATVFDPNHFWLTKSGASPLEFLALLLLALPLVFTLQKLLELLQLGERSHQLAVEHRSLQRTPRQGLTEMHPYGFYLPFLIALENILQKSVFKVD